MLLWVAVRVGGGVVGGVGVAVVVVGGGGVGGVVVLAAYILS